VDSGVGNGDTALVAAGLGSFTRFLYTRSVLCL
jgi:hypothetical protein